MKTFIHTFPKIFVLAAVLCAASCANEVDYEDFIKDRDKAYPGILSSMIFRSGDGKIVFEGVADNDPKVNRCAIFWNSGADSVVLPIGKTANPDLVTTTLNLPENIYHFTVYTYDVDGYRSVPANFVSRSYGDSYRRSIVSRRCGTPMLDDQGAGRLTWSPLDLTFGPLSTVVTYTKGDGTEATVETPVSENETVLEEYMAGTSFSYQTVYRPDTTCVNLFYTEPIVRPMYFNVDRSAWTATASSFSPSGGNVEHMFDGDKSTFWHSRWEGGNEPYPYTIVIDMNDEILVHGFLYTVRDIVDSVRKLTLSGSLDNETWEEIGTFEIARRDVGGVTQSFTLLKDVTARYLKLYLFEGYGENANIAEFEVIGM